MMRYTERMLRIGKLIGDLRKLMRGNKKEIAWAILLDNRSDTMDTERETFKNNLPSL